MSRFVPQGMGWIPDLPDARDYTYRHGAVLPLLQRLKRARCKKLPENVDLRVGDEGESLFTEPEDQGPLNCSASFAIVSMIEYFERRCRGCTFEASKLFLYKVTRNRLQKQWQVGEAFRHSMGDTGADLRTTLKVLAQFGVPPEEHWPYHIDNFDVEPTQFLYNLAKPLAAIRYLRLDNTNRKGTGTWEAVKSFLAAGFPIAFGFPVPSSLTADGDIPYRPEFDSVRGGQAAVAVGYKKDHFGRRQDGLLIRCSWGRTWGRHGYGWLPVAYVRNQLARDFWTLTSEEWLDPTELSQPTVIKSDGSKGRGDPSLAS